MRRAGKGDYTRRVLRVSKQLLLSLTLEKTLWYSALLSREHGMRVIAGTHKGRRLASPKQDGVRPTSDKVKEALFSILSPRLPDARFVDLYAGTGAIGIEALSRGARRAIFVEPSSTARRLLRLNLAQCGLMEAAQVYAGTAEAFLREAGPSQGHYDIVFADPPYHAGGTESLLGALQQCPFLDMDSTVVIEHFSKLSLPAQVGTLSRVRQYRYGDTTLSLFRVPARATDTQRAIQSP